MANIVIRLNFDPIGGASSAAGVSYDNTISGLTATNVQDAIDELDSTVDTNSTDIAAETARALAAEQALDDRIDQEIIDRTADVDAEEARALAAEALLIPLSQKAAPNGVATLDGSGLVPSAQLPSYVDDVLEYANLAAFPVTGETGKIYVALDTGKVYRWSGSVYIEINVAPVQSVFGRTGTVISVSGDYIASQVTNVPSGNLSATNVQTALNELQSDVDTRALNSDLTAHINDTVDAHDASAISSIPSGNLAATEVQAALNELQTDIDTRALDSDLDAEIARATAAEQAVQDNLDVHIGDTTGAHAATSISNTPSGTISSITVQAAINELDSDIQAETARALAAESVLQDNIDDVVIDLSVHITDTVDAHDASAISNIPSGNLEATDVQSALNELQSDIDTRALDSVLTAHITDTTDAHDATAISYDNTTSGLVAIEVQSAIDEVNAKIDNFNPGSAGDISEMSFSLTNNQSSPANVTGFLFPTGVVRSFDALVSVQIDATSDLFAEYKINGIQKSADFAISVERTGDATLIDFTITSSGQIQYTSANYSGFSSGLIKFRAISTSV